MRVHTGGVGAKRGWIEWRTRIRPVDDAPTRNHSLPAIFVGVGSGRATGFLRLLSQWCKRGALIGKARFAADASIGEYKKADSRGVLRTATAGETTTAMKTRVPLSFAASRFGSRTRALVRRLGTLR